MKTLIKYECSKLWKRKIIISSILLLSIFCILKIEYFQTNETKAEVKQGQVRLSSLNGPMDSTFETKMNAAKEHYKKQQAPLTDLETFKIDALYEEPDRAFLNYENNLHIQKTILQKHDSPLKDRYLSSIHGDYIYNAKGINWASTIYNIDLTSYYMIFICISICISTIFSYDRERHVEEILLTTKEGRRKCIIAKLIICYTAACIIWLTFISIPILLLYLNYGFDGYQGTLSLYYPYNSGFVYTFSAMFFWQCLLSFAGMIIFTSITAFISRISNSMLTAIITAFAFFFIPLFLSDIPLLQALMYYMPSFTARLLTSFGDIQGIQLGNIALLHHEYVIPLNLFIGILLAYILYISYQIPFIKRRVDHDRTYKI